jgi:hypothetical protein
MNARIIRLLVAAGVLLLISWIAWNTSFEDTKIPVPLHGEALRNPFYVAIRFSETLGAEASWERVFSEPRKDAVIVLSSWNWTLSRARRERLEHWVEDGGRLIIDDSLIGGFEEFKRWSGISEFEIKHPKKDKLKKGTEEAPPQDEEDFFSNMLPGRCDALTEEGSGQHFQVCGIDPARALTSSRKILWALRDEQQKIHALRTAVGRGSVTVINGSPFQRRDFLAGDHPLLFATMTQLHHGDLLLFLTEENQASLVSLMWRFGAPAVLLLLACVALALWRASPRFGPPAARAPSARRSLAEQIRGTGQFALRFGGGKSLHAAAARALRDAAIRRFPRFDRMSSEERVATLAKASSLSPDDLGPAMNNSGMRSSQDLRQAIAVLETARRRLLTKAKHGN